MTWTHTTRGRRLDLLDPRPDDVDLDEIALALGNQCRYAGCVRRFYSVAEHSCLIASALRRDGESLDVQLAGLLHDAAEAYTGDITWPMQDALWSTGRNTTLAIPYGEHVRQRYKWVQERLDRLICALVDLDPVLLHHSAVKTADLRILLDERDELLTTPPPEPWYPERIGLRPLGVQVQGFLPPVAGGIWRGTLRRLLQEREVKRG